jgi:hypothetical protein
VSDFLPRELAIAVAVAAIAQGAAIFALRSSSIHPVAAAPEIDQGLATPVKIVPVLDLDLEAPLLKLGGKLDPQKLPDRWVEQAPKARVEEKAFVSTKAGKSEADIPPPEVAVAEAGTPPPPPSAEITKQVDTPIAPAVDPAPPANVAVEGHQDGVKEGTETDPLKARAVDLYRARIIGWFSRRFRVSGSGMAPEELTKYRVSATVELSNDRQVIGYSIVPSGNSVFDAAAKAALEGARGESLPQPPENYPDAVQRSISLTFVCKEKRCD